MVARKYAGSNDRPIISVTLNSGEIGEEILPNIPDRPLGMVYYGQIYIHPSYIVQPYRSSLPRLPFGDVHTKQSLRAHTSLAH